VRDTLQEWRKYLVSIDEVEARPPTWVLPGMLPPGMVLLAGDPKTYKSTIVLAIIKALTTGTWFGDPQYKREPVKRGTAVYFAAEQSMRGIRHAYETRLLKKKRPKGKASFDFILVKNPWEWKLDEVQGERDMVRLITDLKPSVTVVDPLVYFHSLDENDPRLVQPLVPLRQAVLKYGGTLLVVHHFRKPVDGNSKTVDFSRVRGTTALWGMADGGILTRKMSSGAVSISTDFKDFRGGSWVWKPD
jgi:RecA-family ATPase